MFSEAASELSGDDPEVRDLHGIVLRDAPELVPPRQSRRVLAGHPHRDEELNRRIAQVRRDLLVRPIPAVAPVECLADGSITHPVELRLRLRRARNGDVGKVPERRLELAAIRQLEIRPRCLHGGYYYRMTFNKMGTLPLPLALHLATYTVIGLFCAFAGGLNLIDPTKIFPNAVIFLGLAGFSWGYVFGILMARKEVLGLGLVASIGYIVAGIWQLGPHWALGVLLLAIGAYGLATLALYRRQILEA